MFKNKFNMEILVHGIFVLLIILILVVIYQHHTIKGNNKTIQFLIEERKRLSEENLELMREVLNNK